jgi:capsular polysaccharide biosynthesis protein
LQLGSAVTAPTSDLEGGLKQAMEIRDYLRQIRRFLWLVIAAPVVAGLLTGGLMEIRPSQYQANASVVVPAITAAGFSQSAASQYVDTFKDVIVSQPVLTDVHQKFGIPVSELASGLSASTITPSSNIINVVLIGLDKQNLTGAVQEATVDTLNAIAAPRLAQAQNAANNAQTLLTNADTAITNWIGTTGNVDPQEALNNAESQLNVHVGILAQEKIDGNTGAETATNNLINQEKTTVANDSLQLTQYESLANAKAAALSANDHAAQELVDAQALVRTDEQSGTVTAYPAVRLSKLSDTIKFAVIAFAIALLMLLGLLLILELMRPARRVTANAPGQGTLAFGSQRTQYTTVPTSTSVPEPVVAASAATPDAPPSAGSRDPWRASPAATAAPPVVAGNGNGNGHSNGNGNGNGQAYVPEVEADPQRAGLGTAPRR